MGTIKTKSLLIGAGIGAATYVILGAVIPPGTKVFVFGQEIEPTPIKLLWSIVTALAPILWDKSTELLAWVRSFFNRDSADLEVLECLKRIEEDVARIQEHVANPPNVNPPPS